MGESLDAKKLLLPYLQRADELQKHEPLVAYYCRLYAMERGLKIPSKERGKTVNGLLISLMNQLEKDKKTVKLNADDNMYLEGFATRVFSKADKQDRAGRADLSTTKTFYAASIFFEVLHQFGEIPPDIEQRQKYAVWKAADIRKALSEGRKPIAGPPGGDEEFSDLDFMSIDPEGGAGAGAAKAKTTVSSPPPDVPSADVELPSAGVGYQPPPPQKPDSIPHTSSFDSFPSTHTDPPSARGSYHTRQASSDDIDLPAAPTQPIHPGAQHSSSPPGYSNDFPSQYNASFTPTGHDEDVPSPVIHDWSGRGLSNENDLPQNDHPQYSSPFTFPTTSSTPDDYNMNNGGYSSIPPPPSTAQSPYMSPTDQHGYNNYSQYSSAPAPGYDGGSSYPPVSPQNYGTPYTEPPQHAPQHLRTASAPIMSQGSGFSNGIYPSDVNYHPPPDKVAEAHKSARFAVSSLAFDDVPTALEYLRKSLELLTVPPR